jgi:hypothetical protein
MQRIKVWAVRFPVGQLLVEIIRKVNLGNQLSVT